jgi:alkanesulfonate monooxygenase SsuD/methylene tetrahydromethanopterin reductase-like flavin-dependent oxidoreductase (luciferase family)
MEFGVFVQGYKPEWLRPGDPNAEHEALLDDVAVAMAAEEAGFKYFWASEHHFLTEYSHQSASEITLAFVAGKTSRIHIAPAIWNILPQVNNPIRVAERAALLDHLSNGRFELGTGRGAGSHEVTGFGVDGIHVTKELWDEAIREIIRMWCDEEYSYEGKAFSVPLRNIIPKPYSKPHPPLWMSAGNPPTYEKAARLGLGVVGFFLTGIDGIAPQVDVYKQNISNAEPIGAYINDNVMLSTRLVCLEDGARAREVCRQMRPGYHRSLVYRYHDTFPHPPNAPVWPEMVPEPSAEDIDIAIRQGFFVCGDPEECIAQIKRYEAIGADQMAFALPYGMPREIAKEVIDVFGKYVIPAFDLCPEYRSDRNRLAAG